MINGSFFMILGAVMAVVSVLIFYMCFLQALFQKVAKYEHLNQLDFVKQSII